MINVIKFIMWAYFIHLIAVGIVYIWYTNKLIKARGEVDSEKLTKYYCELNKIKRKEAGVFEFVIYLVILAAMRGVML